MTTSCGSEKGNDGTEESSHQGPKPLKRAKVESRSCKCGQRRKGGVLCVEESRWTAARTETLQQVRDDPS